MVNKKIILTLLIIFILALSVVLIVSFTDLSGTSNNLAGTEWVLQWMNGKPPQRDTNITLVFSEDTLSGFAGCNGYGSPFEIKGAGQISISEISSQLQACLEPEGVMDQESTYLNLLLNITQFKLNESGMTLYFSTNETEDVLLFNKRETFDMDPEQLENHQWKLITMNGAPVKYDQSITIYFSGGEINGYAGCRNYEGTYEAEGDEIIFPLMSMIDEICSSNDLLLQESDFTTALSLATHYLVKENELELYLATGKVLVFEQMY